MKVHRDLAPFPLADALHALSGGVPALMITMSVGQWDTTLATAYDLGWILLELDEHEMPVRAYRKANWDVDKA